MLTYSPDSQMNFAIQWFKQWSEYQKEDFCTTLGQLLKDNVERGAKGDGVDGLVNGVTTLSTVQGRPPTLFRCQLKLFNEWWATWTGADRDKMTALLEEADPAFYEAVKLEVVGDRRPKLNEDFMTVSKSDGEASNGEAQERPKFDPPVFNVTKVLINGGPTSFNVDVTSASNHNGDESDPSATNGTVITVEGGSDSTHETEDDRTTNGTVEPVVTEI